MIIDRGFIHTGLLGNFINPGTFKPGFQGLTVLDQPETSRWRFPSSSHAAARKEVWSLLEAIGLSEDGRRAAAPAAKAAAAAR